MKLYSNRFAPSPRRVRMYAAEKGLALEVVEVDIGAGATQAADFLAINPLGELPVLELADGTRFFESISICRWLEELQPEPALFGRVAAERARINGWIDRLMFRLYVPLVNVFRHTHPYWATRLTQIPAWGEAQRAAARAEFAALDAALAGQEFLAGSVLSMADIVAFTSVDFGKPSKLRVGESEPHLKRWYAAMNARPSARA